MATHVICSPNLDEVVTDDCFSPWNIIRNDDDCTNEVERRLFKKGRNNMLNLQDIFDSEEMCVRGFRGTESPPLPIDKLKKWSKGWIENNEADDFIKYIISMIENTKSLMDEPMEIVFYSQD